MTYRLTPQAVADLADIADHIAADSPPAARRFLERIEERCRTLSEHPRSGPARADIAPDARAWTVGKYLILYRVAADGAVEVVRVVHGAQDLGRIAF